MVAQDYLRQAQAFVDAGSFRRGLERALEGLQQFQDDPQLLRIAGQCGLELGLDNASAHLRRATELAPDDADAWHGLGLCLLAEGDLPGAAESFRQSLRFRPDEAKTLVDLGHTLYALGQADEAIAVLRDAVKQQPEDLATLRGLVELYRRAGRLEDALQTAVAIQAIRSNDAVACMDAAGLHLALGQFAEAADAYRRLRALDSEPGHEAFAYHGMIEAEIRQERWRRALDLAIDAAAIDRYDVTTQLLAYVALRLFGRSDRQAPPWPELEAMLAAEREDHRRQHAEALAL